jgi:hypothetical protein
MFLTCVSPASLLDVYGGFTTRCLWWLNQVDLGADNPRHNIPNCHETRKGGQGSTLGCSAIDDDDLGKCNRNKYTIINNVQTIIKIFVHN